jgi:hypothetical protein
MKRIVLLLVLTVVALPLARAQTNSAADSTATNTPAAGPVVMPQDASPVPAPDIANTQAVPPASAPMGGSMAPGMSAPATAAPAAGGQQDDIYDIHPPFFYLHSWFWLWVALAALALLAILIFLWIRYKPLRSLRAKSAYELALEKLENAKALLNEENPEPYAVAVSETIRSYLGQRFETPSTRRTTEEFLGQMQADTATPLAEHRDLLRGFLESCDLVKFAHYQPSRDELEQVQQRAVTFVTATKPIEGSQRPMPATTLAPAPGRSA